MRKWTIKFLRKFENHSIKIAGVNLILITKSINLQLFTFILFGFGVPCDLDQSIYREVYDDVYIAVYSGA